MRNFDGLNKINLGEGTIHRKIGHGGAIGRSRKECGGMGGVWKKGNGSGSVGKQWQGHDGGGLMLNDHGGTVGITLAQVSIGGASRSYKVRGDTGSGSVGKFGETSVLKKRGGMAGGNFTKPSAVRIGSRATQDQGGAVGKLEGIGGSFRKKKESSGGGLR